jgi:hypothetical protein
LVDVAVILTFCTSQLGISVMRYDGDETKANAGAATSLNGLFR